MAGKKQKNITLNLKFSPLRICAFVCVAAVLLVSLFFTAQIERALFGVSGNGGDWSYVSGTLAVHYVDVGQGDCSIIQLPDGKLVVIDGGKPNQYSVVDAYIKKLRGNDKTVDYVILTHPHDDHYGGLNGVLKNYDVDVFYRPPEHAGVINGLPSLDGIDVRTNSGGLQISGTDYSFYFYAAQNWYSDKNDYSPIIELTAFSQTFYFTGDATTKSENEFLAQGGGAASSVLQVGHHGSKHSSSQNFLNAIHPSNAVIPVGVNSYGHPTQEAIGRLQAMGATIYRTDLNGSVVFSVNSGGLTIVSDFVVGQMKWIYIVCGGIVIFAVLFFTKI